MGNQYLFVFFTALLAVNQSNCLRCYACGEPNTFLGENYTKVMPCRDFDEVTDPKILLERFVIECPSEYVGCITQKQGGQVMRTCDTFAFEDCQTANGVTYCYCNHDLCNGKLPQNQPRREENHNLSDDEDYSEMSGFGEEEHIKEGSEEIGFRSNATENQINSTRETSAPDETSTRRPPQSSSSRTSIKFSLVLLLHVVIIRL